MPEAEEQGLPQNRVLILAGGDLDPNGGHSDLLRGPWRHIICADGGARHARALGVQPTLLIGDMDSIDSLSRQAYCDVPTLALPDAQDKTDSQLAIEWALGEGAEHIVVAGGLGSRFDHSLANAQLLALIARAGKSGVVTDGRQAVHLLTHELALQAPPGYLLSVIALGECRGLDLKGLRWDLDNFDLAIGETRTISNEFTEGVARLSLKSGVALVVTGPRDRAGESV